ncbi:MAG TPA: hypothetical protein VLL05_22700, partial [Terriglobales bacterium]|nr:hypothetical protein [Terriglobales bacterium]
TPFENEAGKRPVSAHLRYGLPCVKCRLYYDADVSACPICGCSERVPAPCVTRLGDLNPSAILSKSKLPTDVVLTSEATDARQATDANDSSGSYGEGIYVWKR